MPARSSTGPVAASEVFSLRPEDAARLAAKPRYYKHAGVLQHGGAEFCRMNTRQVLEKHIGTQKDPEKLAICSDWVLGTANGLVRRKVKLASFAAPERTEEVSLLVDTGATLTWVPREILERLVPLPFRDSHSRLLTDERSRGKLPRFC